MFPFSRDDGVAHEIIFLSTPRHALPSLIYLGSAPDEGYAVGECRTVPSEKVSPENFSGKFFGVFIGVIFDWCVVE